MLKKWARILTHRREQEQSPAANPVQGWLDGTAVPWRLTRGELMLKYGTRVDSPFSFEEVYLQVSPPPLRDLLYPLSFLALSRFSPAMPPVRLSAYLSVGDDTEENIQHAVVQCARLFGPAEVRDVYNTRSAVWRWGAASIRLTVWPPERRERWFGNNNAHKRDPRLVNACSMAVNTGWRPPLAQHERVWLDDFKPLGETRNWQLKTPRQPLEDAYFRENWLEYMRAPYEGEERLRGRFGCSADGRALIACEDALLIIPMAQIALFKVRRVLPAKGRGGSTLMACCATGYEDCPVKEVTIAEGEKADDLNDLVAQMAARTGIAFELTAYDYDC
ncbi:hypothetical protein SAMN02746095_02321 [Acidocella aminolytica 101 = DSM 11237]|jgi:hypothetical protein|nr:hypothetical protein SAMN02746095_02321 [Acidocella aminolytica 101 = DSM 11237]